VLKPEPIYAEEIQERQIQPPPDAAQFPDHDKLRLHWLSAIRNREKSASDIELGTKVMVIVDLATRSIWDGNAYSYDPERQRVKKI
jgi:hypothetical protein